MKKAVFFLLEDYSDWEGAYLSSRLNMKDEWTINTASMKKGICQSIGGFTTVIDYALEDIPSDIDLFVLIGGNSWHVENEDLSNCVSFYLKKGVIVGAICGAVDFLARNGQLNDFKHTGNSLQLWKEYTDYRNRDNFIKEQAITDRNLVTANGTAAIEFSENILNALNFETVENIQRTHELFKLGYYAYTDKYGDPYSS